MSKYSVLKLSFVVTTALAATSALAQSGAVTVTQNPSGATTVIADRMIIDTNGNVVAQSDLIPAVVSGNAVQITADEVTVNADGSVVWTGNPRLSHFVQPNVTVITSDGAPINLTEAQSLSNTRQIERVEMAKGSEAINIVRKR